LISVVIPTLDAEDHLVRTLSSLVPGVVEGLIKEVIVVDGGSQDSTLEIADSTGCEIIRSDQARGLQLWHGCKAAKGDWLLILHSDSQLGEGWLDAVRWHMKNFPLRAAYFELKFDDASALSKVWAEAVAMRARWLAMPSGDHGLLLSKPLYDSAGGYKDQAAFEDVALAMALGRARLRPLAATLTTGADRFRFKGWRVALMTQTVRFVLYLLGVPPKPPVVKKG